MIEFNSSKTRRFMLGLSVVAAPGFFATRGFGRSPGGAEPMNTAPSPDGYNEFRYNTFTC